MRDGFTIAGAGPGVARSTLATVVCFAAVVAVRAVPAGCAGVAVLGREPAGGRRGLLPRAPAHVVLPPLPGKVPQDGDLTTIGQIGLT